jgi:hypothetical protein
MGCVAMLQAAGAEEGNYCYHARAGKEDEAMLAVGGWNSLSRVVMCYHNDRTLTHALHQVIFKGKCTFHSISIQDNGSLYLNGRPPHDKDDIRDVTEVRSAHHPSFSRPNPSLLATQAVTEERSAMACGSHPPSLPP